jgi:hypothetical protein
MIICTEYEIGGSRNAERAEVRHGVGTAREKTGERSALLQYEEFSQKSGSVRKQTSPCIYCDNHELPSGFAW